MFMKKLKYTKETLELIVHESYSVRQVLIKLGLREAGGNYSNIKSKIKYFGISTDHFHGMLWSKGKTIKRNKDFSKILCENSNYSSGLEYSSNALRKLLFKYELKKQCCEECDVSEWKGQQLSLELHHKNGIRNDNRIENLKILCPNCHSITDNFRKRKKILLS